MKKIRLQKLLAAAGVASRRKSEEIIAQKRVCVNGQMVDSPGAMVDESAEILVDGKKIRGEKKYYILLNKPEGVVTTVSDPQGRPTVMDFAPRLYDSASRAVRLFPVGRLDLDSSGMIFLTNDGDWANALMHPSHEIIKTYHVIVEGRAAEASLQQLRGGVILDGRKTAVAEVKARRLPPTSAGRITTSLVVKIHEGRKRQVRRMCETIGHPVITLKRVAIGAIRLGDLPPGKWRYLSDDEVKNVKV
ncbi:MAG: rRNA pseudouridine synthase [Defluviitaleaceae bacterium]|nr:rRNA pseudouridine synthase [Defluviitaleaceae bacterium]